MNSKTRVIILVRSNLWYCILTCYHGEVDMRFIIKNLILTITRGDCVISVTTDKGEPNHLTAENLMTNLLQYYYEERSLSCVEYFANQ